MRLKFLSILSFIFILLTTVSTVYASNPTVIKAMVSGSHTILIVFSEPVQTSLGDYIGVGGPIMGKSPSSLSGNGTSNITLTFDSLGFIPGAKGSISIGASLKSLKDGKSFIPTTIFVDDGQIPTVNSFSVQTSGTLTTKNSNIYLSFTTNKNVLTPIVTIGNSPISIVGQERGPFSGSYTVLYDVVNSLPITITLTDEAQNVSKITTGFSIGTLPSIASITSDAQGNGPVNLGKSITFTLTPTFISPNAKIRAIYNGELLTWNTDNGGKTYTAVYTVTKDSISQSFPMQLTDVTLTDQFGNTSSFAKGDDVQKFIDTSPSLVVKTEPILVKEKVEVEVKPVVVIKGKFTKTLKKGSTGTEVKDLQKKLTSLGFYKGPITGSFGSETEVGVKKLQAKYKLEQSGEVGRLTRNILNK
jgi:hypothetical protein